MEHLFQLDHPLVDPEALADEGAFFVIVHPGLALVVGDRGAERLADEVARPDRPPAFLVQTVCVEDQPTGFLRQQLLDLYTKYRDQMYQKLPQLFGTLPKNKLAVVPMESYRSPDGVPADYSIGAGDGSRPGRINVNEYAPEKRLLLNVEAIAYHEGVPGHHLQYSIAQELTGIPPFRKYNLDVNAFTEGWAFYSERLGKEVGFYQDPYSDYGRLQNEMWRAVRWVVDTGVHEKHWSRQQMIDFFHEHTAMDDQNIETEVDRYIAWPAQALSYKMGQRKILELRERAQRNPGDRCLAVTPARLGNAGTVQGHHHNGPELVAGFPGYRAYGLRRGALPVHLHPGRGLGHRPHSAAQRADTCVLGLVPAGRVRLQGHRWDVRGHARAPGGGSRIRGRPGGLPREGLERCRGRPALHALDRDLDVVLEQLGARAHHLRAQHVGEAIARHGGRGARCRGGP